MLLCSVNSSIAVVVVFCISSPPVPSGSLIRVMCINNLQLVLLHSSVCYVASSYWNVNDVVSELLQHMNADG